MENKKKYEISFVSVILCMMVIFIHVSSEITSALPVQSLSYALAFVPWRLSSFAVHGFIFLSGFKLNLKKEIHYPSFYKRRLMTVVIPYIIWVAVYYMYFCHEGYFSFNPADLGGYILRGDLSAHFYFVVVIVQFYLLFPMWRKLFTSFTPGAVLPLAALLTVMSQLFIPEIFSRYTHLPYFDFSDKIFTSYLLEWAAGCYCGIYYDKFIKNIKGHKKAVYITALVLTVLDLLVSYDGKYHSENIYWLPYIHTSFCLFATLALYSIGLSVCRNENTFIIWSDRASYYIYLVHCLIIAYLTNYFNSLPYRTPLSIRFAVLFVITYVLSFVVCIIYANAKYTIKKHMRKK